MNYGIIFRILSFILLALAVAFSVCLGTAYWYQEQGRETGAIQGFLFSIFIALAISLTLFLLSGKPDKRFYKKEGMALIGLSWILATIAGALPYIFIVTDCSVSNAIFESASGLTTTGATVFSDFVNFPKSLLLWRSLSQWIGGLGVVVLFVALLSSLGAGAKVLFSNESSGKSGDMDYGRVQEGASRIMKLYLSLSVVCAITFKVCGMEWFDAICHMFTTLSTGGFSTRAMSVEEFASPLLEWAIILFMAISGMSFFVLLRIFGEGSVKEPLKSSETKGYYSFLLIGTLLVCFILFKEGNIEGIHGNLRAGAFQVVSIMTSTGYSSTDFNSWPVPATMILVILMFIGGCTGSTGGGCKVIRWVVALKLVLKSLTTSFRGKLIVPVKINGSNMSVENRKSILNYLVMVAFIFFVSLIFVSMIDPSFDITSIFTAVASCFLNVGPGLGSFGPTENYGALHGASKIYLSVLMIAGRIEVFALLALFFPSLWRRF